MVSAKFFLKTINAVDTSKHLTLQGSGASTSEMDVNRGLNTEKMTTFLKLIHRLNPAPVRIPDDVLLKLLSGS